MSVYHGCCLLSLLITITNKNTYLINQLQIHQISVLTNITP